ncbi:hypothetical protein [uncultured Roseobacter sp.]|uniref:hypothetical protein n=1 Tax=uncultured Roseobacter sp. TaxID=114847 RepID=UPI0026215B0D|nr:hypothetical protein [uncultured Roseobacter sp.]
MLYTNIGIMELTYPINLVGADDGAARGDLLTRHGEFLGTWILERDEGEETGIFYFIADGETEPMLTEEIAFLSSGMRMGLAMSSLCRSIREWHDQQS